MSKTIRRNGEALAMILSGKGKKQVFQDRRNKRSKDRKKSWQQDHAVNG